MNLTAVLFILGVLACVLTPLILALVGIQRGLEGRQVIFSGWGDFLLSCAVVLSVLFSLPWFFGGKESAASAVPVIGCISALWLLLTWLNTRTLSELWFSVPAKLGLVSVAILGALFALHCIEKALKKDMSPREKVLNAMAGAGAGASAWGAMKLIRELIQQAHAHAGRMHERFKLPPSCRSNTGVDK